MDVVVISTVKNYSLIQLCFPSTSFIIATITLTRARDLSVSENQDDG